MLRRSGTTAVLLTLLMLLGACTSNTEAGAPSVEAEEPPADTGGDSGLLAQPTAPVEAPTEPSAEPAAEQPAEPSPAPTEASAPESAQVDLTVLNIALEPVAGGLRLPIGLAHAGDGSRRLFVVEKDGTIASFRMGSYYRSRSLISPTGWGRAAASRACWGWPSTRNMPARASSL